MSILDMIQIPKNPRKLKRFIENEAYAKDARFWVGKIRSADRSEMHAQPINSQAVRQTRNKVRRSRGTHDPKNVVVYVVHFAWIGNPGLCFLKIGLTHNTVAERFASDADRYIVTVIHQTSGVSRRDAAILERSLHDLFAPKSMRPPSPLVSGGNTECFAYSAELEAEMRKAIDCWHSSVGRAVVS